MADGFEALKTIVDVMRQGFLLFDDQWRIRNFNPRLHELCGLPSGVVRIGASALELTRAEAAAGHYPGRTVDEAYEAWRLRLTNRTSSDRLNCLADGRTLAVSCAPIGESGWLITYEDVSARIKSESALIEQGERLQLILRNIPVGVCMFDRSRRLILCNAHYAQLYALPAELTMVGAALERILAYRATKGSLPVDMKLYIDVINEAETTGSSRSARVLLQDGRTIRLAHSGGFVATHEDITEAVQAEEQIRFLGSHDALTGLANRTALRERMAEALSRPSQGEMFCVHCLDLDDFKSVNDAQGHPIGDLLLRQVAQRLQECLGERDAAFRLGGDEFVVLQAKVEKPEQAASLAQRLVAAMADPFDLEGRPVFVGVSVGVSVCPNDAADVDTLMKNADLAMCRSKSEGRNTYRFFEFAMDACLKERRQLERDLEQAIANGEFELFYQPQVDAGTEIIIGCGALLQWNHPTRGRVAPAEFIPIAEEIGVMIPLGAWVLQKACNDAASWPRHAASPSTSRPRSSRA